jgi:hypothetical protein
MIETMLHHEPLSSDVNVFRRPDSRDILRAHSGSVVNNRIAMIPISSLPKCHHQLAARVVLQAALVAPHW